MNNELKKRKTSYILCMQDLHPVADKIYAFYYRKSFITIKLDIECNLALDLLLLLLLLRIFRFLLVPKSWLYFNAPEKRYLVFMPKNISMFDFHFAFVSQVKMKFFGSEILNNILNFKMINKVIQFSKWSNVLNEIATLPIYSANLTYSLDILGLVIWAWIIVISYLKN